MIPDERSAVRRILKLARPGDLVLIFADAIQRSWQQIIQFSPDDDVPTETQAAAIPIAPAEFIDHDLDLGEGLAYVRDDRGVRLARETED